MKRRDVASENYKKAAIEHADKHGVASAADEFGCDRTTISVWRREFCYNSGRKTRPIDEMLKAMKRKSP